ncbi:MAG TPA: hypothetical protein VJP76_00720 [Candidatus Tumulicola sp.]|nr:hypothetical protein [Candidatus Tumulicola sp.]
MKYELRIRLMVWNPSPGKTDFAKVHDALGLDIPYWRWQFGDPIDRVSGRQYKTDGIGYRVSKTYNSNATTEIEKLLAMLDNAGAAARRLFAENSAELSIVGRIYLEDVSDEPMKTPSFHLPAHTVSKISEYGLELDVDLYVLDAGADRGFGKWGNE